ncbi:DNA-binding transcriptional regulator YhcF, GntR family [Verrucomicrobium sp. GAS474]|uniref:GntR family transcriptional regulator n=1 Tax=Verrucomicrobium sp. GAS474 TaxID=1882831 RepID=UPI00087DE1F3|nr:GntR family transcriptional regulator [Verrucomicrobium sp. GAS474]SDT99534.1 DNA-binding transcriptional regulator YhcF, GntR family [Verrucomicrobium sp. GAS474]
MSESSTDLIEAIRFGFFAEKGTSKGVFGKKIILEIKKALLAGKIRSGEAFPTVHQLSEELHIPAKIAFQVISSLMAEGILEIQEGMGTTIKGVPPSSPMLRSAFLSNEAEHFATEARFLGLKEGEVLDTLRSYWI